MFREPTLRPRPARRRAARRGQSIVVALLVLLLLGLAGALFVTIVARNLLNATHASRVVTADQYARAGITFADAQLSSSLDGADWRPPLQTTLLNPPTEAREQARYNAAVALNKLGAPDPNDPDARYLEAGFARYNTGAGRFLLRVTYTPVLLKDTQGQYYDPVIGKDATGTAYTPVAVPPGKYLKIESIGREGVIDPLDPTTYSNNRSSDRLQAYQVAYKPIGITDYARFETNPDNRATTADIGVTSRYYAQDTDGGIVTPGVFDFSNPNSSGVTLQPYPVLTTYGAADAYQSVSGVLLPNPNAGSATKIASGAGAATLPGGGSFHANMPVRFFGKNITYLNDAGLSAPLYQDGMEIVGDLLLNGYKANVKPDNSNVSSGGQIAALILNPPDLSTLKTNGTNGTFIVPSNDPGGAGTNGGFDTHDGLVRDGSPQNDINGRPRSIGRLEPPRMDATESSSQLPRYKAIAMTSPPRTYADPTDPNGTVKTAPLGAGQYGYGQSIYINNPNDIQQNSTAIGGGSTLVDDWLNRTNPGGGISKGNWNGDFYDPPGVNITLGRLNQMRNGNTISAYGIRMTLTPGSDFPNPDGSAGTLASQTVLYDDLGASSNPATATGGNADNDVLIYAEGNVRVHGIASADPNDPDTTLTSADKYPRHITIVTNGTAYIDGSLLKGNPDSSITVLAHDYVCVNTTQFLAGPRSDDASLGTPPAFSTTDYLTFGSDEPTLIQELNFGLPNGGTPNAAYNSPLGLYVSARPGDTGATEAEFDLVNPATGLSIANNAPFTTPFWNPSFGATAAVIPNSGQQYFSLSSLMDNSLATPITLGSLVESDTRLLETRRNSNPADLSATQDLELERVAVLPMDIRIEAVLYAQTGSFFVIPGDWFNSSTADLLDGFAASVTATTMNGIRTFGADPHFPFYGQPIDMKITIDGAVSEAQPADVAEQTAWMLKWGWIPQYHGYASQGAAGSGPPLEYAGHVLMNGNSPANKPDIGLQIIYNPQAGYPYNPINTVAVPAHYLRSDAYGRPLPFSPKLPVSTGLLFAGESSEPPLLQ